MARLTRLFEPIKLGSLKLDNRLVMSAMTTHYDYDDSDRQVNFYAARAKGGVGLIVIGALQALYPGRRADIGKVNIYEDADIPKLKEWNKVVHDNGSKTAAQLAVYGYWSPKGKQGTPEDVGPSAVEIPTTGLHPAFERADYLPRVRALTVEEIRVIEESIGDAASRARAADFDAIELQAVGGNLFDRFINPFTNRRTDEYGGPLQNRARLLLETVAIIKKRVGDSFPFICRISGDDMLPWGVGLEVWKEIASMIEKAGVHALSMYPGWHETRAPRQQMSVPRGNFVYLAEGIKQAVKIPVITNIRINDPALAEKILIERKADMVAMAAPLLADPELPNKAREGRLADIRMCTACCMCWDDLIRDVPVACTVNAQLGKEAERAIVPTKQPKRVVVIGGGPGGMEAARVAALRGHKVVLFEKDSKLGGQLLYAIVPPHKEEWGFYIDYLATQVKKLGVEIRLNEEATPVSVAELKPDVVMVATGAEPLIPNIPGASCKTAVSPFDVLSGTPVGRTVVIVGGGSTGCETAEFLHQQGRKVTILEMLPSIAADMGPKNRWVMIDRLAAAGIRMETSTAVTEITDKGVRTARHRKYVEFFEADTVVLAVGMKPVAGLAKALEGKAPEIRQIGDCVKPSNVRKAVEDGFLAATQV